MLSDAMKGAHLFYVTLAKRLWQVKILGIIPIPTVETQAKLLSHSPQPPYDPFERRLGGAFSWWSSAMRYCSADAMSPTVTFESTANLPKKHTP